MKKYFLLLTAVVVVYFLWTGKEKEKIAPRHTLTRRASPDTKPSNYFLSKREGTTDIKVSADSCKTISRSLNEMDFNLDVTQWISSLNQDDYANCADPGLKEKITHIQATCFNKINKDECFTNLIMLRSLMRSRKIKDPSTREELADLIMAEFSKKNPDFKKLRDLSGELLKKDPNDRPVQKVWAMSAVINGNPEKISPELREEIYRTLDPELIMTDPEMRGLDVILKTGLKPDSVEAYTRDILKENPEDASSREMLGWSLWQQGRRTEALNELDAILAMKKDPYLQKLRKILADPHAKKDSFPGRLSLGVRLEDLWN